MKPIIILCMLLFSSESTVILLSGKVTCENTSNRVWCVSVNALEYDYFGKSEWIGGIHSCSRETEIEYHIDGECTDDGPFDRRLELAYHIHHTCTPTGSTEHYFPSDHPVPLKHESYYEYMSVDLTSGTIERRNRYCDGKWCPLEEPSFLCNSFQIVCAMYNYMKDGKSNRS